jgi:hypothetical protein
VANLENISGTDYTVSTDDKTDELGIGPPMTDHSWLQLTVREHAIVLDALISMLNADPANDAEVENLVLKLAQAQPHPDITVGVHGGLVQWVLGNPFPIRICDYDGCDLPDLDERGQPCAIWFEQPKAEDMP